MTTGQVTQPLTHFFTHELAGFGVAERAFGGFVAQPMEFAPGGFGASDPLCVSIARSANGRPWVSAEPNGQAWVAEGDPLA